MVKISIFKEKPYDNSGLSTVWRIRLGSGRLLEEYKREADAVLAAWKLVKTYGLTLVEPW